MTNEQLKVKQKPYKNYIGGQWVESSSKEVSEVENPATGDVIGYAQRSDVQDVHKAIQSAKHAFHESDWAYQPKMRYEAMTKLAKKMKEKLEHLAHTLTMENGKALWESRKEIHSAIDMLQYFAGMSRNVFGRTATLDTSIYGQIVKEPVGVVGIISPWNWPVLLLMRELSPALAAGNAVIVKPATSTPLTTLEIFQCIAEMEEFPHGIVNVITGPGSLIGPAMSRSMEIDMISFTGDTETGRDVMKLSTANFKHLALELGGKSPNIVFEDADLDKAIQTIGDAAFISAGQMCFAGTRVIVQDTVKEQVIQGLKEYAENLIVGNGLREDTDMGPLASKSQLNTVKKYAEIAKNEGTIITGGYQLSGEEYDHGYFFAPTIVDDLPPDSRIVQEEIFGPILAIQTFKTEKEAIELANNSIYGLAAGVWSQNVNVTTRVARAIKAGTVWINTYNRNFAEAEFGGYKQSGVGRTRGIEGLMSYTETKHINVAID